MTAVDVSFNHSSYEYKVFSQKAGQLLQLVVNSCDFKTQVINTKFTNTRFVVGNSTSQDLSNSQILSLIETGKEFRTQPDGTINIDVALSKLDDAAGYVQLPSLLITTDIDFYKRLYQKGNLPRLANHWMHEWLHVCGFKHKSNQVVDRNDVAYAIGRIVELVSSRILAEQLATFGLEELPSSESENEYEDFERQMLNDVGEDEQE